RPGAALAGELGAKGCSTSAEGDAGAAAGSTVPVSIPNAIECFDLREIRIDVLEFLAQTLDVTVDRPVVDIDVLAIGRIHQLVAVFDVPRTVRQGFEDQKLGHGQLDMFTLPGTQMPCRIEDQLPAHDDRLAVRVLPFTREFAAPDQRAN